MSKNPEPEDGDCTIEESQGCSVEGELKANAKDIELNNEEIKKLLKDNRLNLVKELNIENVLPCLKSIPGQSPSTAIKWGEIESADKPESTRMLLDYLGRIGGEHEEFKAFIKAVAGTQPKLFESLIKRPPSLPEVDHSIQDFASTLKDVIKEKGHLVESPLDEEIDLDEQYTQLKFEQRNYQYENVDGQPLPTNQRNLETQMSEKQRVEYTDGVEAILSMVETQSPKILMWGKAGVGKTTTMQWLARRWALDKCAMTFPLLFLLQIRHLTNADSQMSLVELLTLNGVFTAGLALSLIGPWLQSWSSRVLVLIDGLDEIPDFASKLKSTPEIVDFKQKAHPIDLCINILRGKLLPNCALISTSRPFSGLSALKYTEFEVQGLTQERIIEFVNKRHPEKAIDIKSTLEKVPILMSFCNITFYCMAITRILADGVRFEEEDVQTYTRFMAFILVRFVSRNLPQEWPFVIEVKPFFSSLARLAYMGIFQTGQEAIKMVFDEYDLALAQLTSRDLDCSKKAGILTFRDHSTKLRRQILAEFAHLSMQELLAISHSLSDASMVRNTFENIFLAGQFNMGLKYLFGLHFDTKSVWIQDILVASGNRIAGTNTLNFVELVNKFLQLHRNNPRLGLQLCQLAHETQVNDYAKLIVDTIALDNKLNMQHIPMTVLDLNAVRFVCRYAKELTDIRFCNVNADDTFIKVFAETFLKHYENTLKTLDISANRIGPTGANSLSKIVYNHRCLRVLDISANNIGGEGAKTIAEMLKNKEDLDTLKISSNNIGGEGINHLIAILKQKKKLHKLFVSNNNIGITGAKAIGEMIQQGTSIEMLDISDNDIKPEGMDLLMRKLKHSTGLHYLNVAHNNIGCQGAKAIGNMLHEHDQLRTLDISNNNIESEGMKALSKGVLKLHELNISHNRLGTSGATSLFHSLETSNNLRSLDVSFNSITANGTKALAKMLKSNHTLHTLNIAANNIGVEGANALTKSLLQNKGLRALEISGNDVGFEGQNAITEACKNRPVEHGLRVTMTFHNVSINIAPLIYS